MIQVTEKQIVLDDELIAVKGDDNAWVVYAEGNEETIESWCRAVVVMFDSMSKDFYKFKDRTPEELLCQTIQGFLFHSQDEIC